MSYSGLGEVYKGSHPILQWAIIVALLGIALTITGVSITAAINGQEVSFWPPKVSERRLPEVQKCAIATEPVRLLSASNGEALSNLNKQISETMSLIAALLKQANLDHRDGSISDQASKDGYRRADEWRNRLDEILAQQQKVTAERSALLEAFKQTCKLNI